MKTIIIIFLFNIFSLFSAQPSIIYHPIVTFENDDTLLSLVETPSGDQYIIKQINGEPPSEQLLLIIDLCASEMGIACDIPLNQVSLIPANVSFTGKRLLHYPATLHKVVPGASTNDSAPWEGFSIHQRFHRPPNLEKVWGKLPEENKGLTQEVLQHMEKHPDLIFIGAFDTFVGNGDRSNPNIFYDRKSDHFWGIDMAASFRSPLATIVYNRLQTNCEYKLPKAFFTTLKKLHSNFPPDKFIALFIHKIIESRYFLSSDTEVWERVFRQTKNFSENYEVISKILEFEKISY